jgi:DNA repair protein RadD
MAILNDSTTVDTFALTTPWMDVVMASPLLKPEARMRAEIAPVKMEEPAQNIEIETDESLIDLPTKEPTEEVLGNGDLVEGELVPVQHALGVSLRSYQKDAVDKTFACIKENPKHGYCISAPCASGKSLMIAEMARRVVCGEELVDSSGRVLVVSHVQEIVQQDYGHLNQLLFGRVGVFSAGLKRRDVSEDVIVAGIQSVWRSTRIGRFDMLVVDEVHLLPPHETSMYRTLLKRLRADNPNLALVGLTATPFRTDGGNIYGKGKLFDKLSYDIDYKTLIDQGFIVRCRAKEIEIMSPEDFQKLRVKMGEYDQTSIDNVYSVLKINDILKDIIHRTEQCKQVLVFSPNVPACYTIQKQLTSFGGAEVITGETPKERRMQLIEDFRNFKFKYLININCLTTGFNVTTIDCVAFVRPTKSPVLYAQTVSRGIRKHEGKEFVTLLDYGGNVRRHGTVDDLYIPDYEERKKKKKGKGKARGDHEEKDAGDDGTIERDTDSDVTKICPQCKEIVRTHVKVCPDCGFDFVAEEERKAEEQRRLLEEAARLEAIEAERVAKEWERKRKENPDEWERGKRQARLEVLSDTNTTFCGVVLGMYVRRYESQYSGKRSLQIVFRLQQNITYQFGGETFQDDAQTSALLWLHFNDVSSGRLAQCRSDWVKLTGLETVFPRNVDEAYEMRDLIMKPHSVRYCVKSGHNNSVYNIVQDIDYGELDHSGVDENLYHEFNRERSLQRVNGLLKYYKVLKRKMKQSMESAESEYEMTVSNAVARYNAAMEQSQSDYDIAIMLKKEADDLMAVYADPDSITEGLNCTELPEASVPFHT